MQQPFSLIASVMVRGLFLCGERQILGGAIATAHTSIQSMPGQPASTHQLRDSLNTSSAHRGSDLHRHFPDLEQMPRA